jgi:hypothetical protein
LFLSVCHVLLVNPETLLGILQILVSWFTTRSIFDESAPNSIIRRTTLLRVFGTIQKVCIYHIDVVVLIKKARRLEVKSGQVRNLLAAKAILGCDAALYGFSLSVRLRADD